VILGLVDHEQGTLDELSLQALALGRRLAESLDTPLEAVLIGSEARPLADDLGRYGVSTVHLVEHPRLDGFMPDAWAASVVQLAATATPDAVIAAGSERGNELLARVAARTGLPMAANCIAVEPGESYVVTRVRWGGSLLEEAGLDGSTKLFTISPHAVPAEETASPSAPEIRLFVPELADDVFRVRVSGRVEPEAGKVSLPEARVVVGGGRGLGSADGFAALEELASLLGGPVGCSRAVTSLGWRPHSDQIGQTGTRIAPDLYIACGISGAIQHMVGCKGAKRILVINTDPHAPILAHADYAVIGDVGVVVPALTEEIRKRGSAS
jgi:electron transfer flavoprotein alpha subunit